MLRRYLIVNGVSTVLLYALVWTLVPSPLGFVTQVRERFETFAIESPLLGPVLPRALFGG